MGADGGKGGMGRHAAFVAKLGRSANARRQEETRKAQEHSLRRERSGDPGARLRLGQELFGRDDDGSRLAPSGGQRLRRRPERNSALTHPVAITRRTLSIVSTCNITTTSRCPPKCTRTKCALDNKENQQQQQLSTHRPGLKSLVEIISLVNELPAVDQFVSFENKNKTEN